MTVAAVRAEALVWVCATCGESIADGEGHLAVSYADLHRHREQRVAWERSHGEVVSAAELAAYPMAARWQLQHRRCDPRPDGNDYWIAIEEIRTALDLVKWCAHLLDKRWLPDTDLADVLRAVRTA